MEGAGGTEGSPRGGVHKGRGRAGGRVASCNTEHGPGCPSDENTNLRLVEEVVDW